MDTNGLNAFLYFCDGINCKGCPFEGEENCALVFSHLDSEEKLEKLEEMVLLKVE